MGLAYWAVIGGLALHKFLILSLLCLCQIVSGRDEEGVWYGKVGASVGTDFKNSDLELFTQQQFPYYSHITGGAKFQLGYKTSKYLIQADLGARTTYRRTSRESASGVVDESDSLKNIGYDYTQTIKSSAVYNADFAAAIFLKPSDRIDIKFNQTFTPDDPRTSFIGISWGDSFRGKESEEISDNKKYSCAPTVEWMHRFEKQGRDLDLKAGWNYVNDQRYTLWRIGITDDIETDPDIRTYRVTPRYVDSDFCLTGTYTDKNFVSVSNLNLILRLNAKLKQDKDDYSAANLRGEEWKDSTSFRESFRYYALTVEPELRVTYSVGHFDFDLSAKPQYYTDKLNDSQHTERFDPGDFAPILKLGTFWNISDSHRIGLSVFRDITRPDYLQMCWFRRPGSYANELQEGNPKLLPSITNRSILEYRFRIGKFTSNLEIGHKYSHNIIEKTFRKEIVDDREFRIVTWINAGYSYNTSTKLTLGWQGKALKGTVSGNYNYFVGIDNSGNEKRKGDYGFNADVQYNWKWDLGFLARFRYQSKIVRNYSSMTEYIGLDVKISKKFFKRLDAFFEANDLFDKPIQTLTESADHLSVQVVTENLTRRLFTLGFNFSF